MTLSTPQNLSPAFPPGTVFRPRHLRLLTDIPVALAGFACIFRPALARALLVDPGASPDAHRSEPARRFPCIRCFRSRASAVAYLISLVFSLLYGYLAARNRTAERLMIPLLDTLQSIPVLCFLPAGHDLDGRAVSHRAVRSGARLHLSHLHWPSVEHGLQRLFVAQKHPARNAGSGRPLRLELVAAASCNWSCPTPPSASSGIR